MRFITSVVVAAAILLTAGAASAQDRPLPEFLVQGADGFDVASSVMSAQPKWLLIYVAPDCRPCNTLLRAMPKWQSAGLMTRVVLVVSGKPADAKAWIDKALPLEMQGLTWFSDGQRSAAKALELTGAPVLIGVRNGAVEWRVAGVLNDPAALESVVRTWVEDKK